MERGKMKFTYTITRETKAIIPLDMVYSRSRIFEGRKKPLSIYTPLQIIDHNCIIHGADWKGRQSAVKDILNSNSKLPVPVSPGEGIFMMPTAAIKSSQCIWIAYHHVKNYEQIGDQTYVHFHDGTGIFVKTTAQKFDNQYKRTSQVIVHFNRYVLFERKVKQEAERWNILNTWNASLEGDLAKRGQKMDEI